MQVHRDIGNLPHFRKAVVTIGTFDGVHSGHQQIIKLLKEQAEESGGETVIITFYPHPRKVVAGNAAEVKLINTAEEKIELLEKKGVEHLVIVPFDDAFANQSAAEYIENFLVKNFRPDTIIIGYDHRFGKNRSGDYHLLEENGPKFHYKVKEIPEHVLNQVTVSSTKIREALLRSNIDTANDFLGYPYFFSGTVVEGNKAGRTIGYPTANLRIEDEEKLIPGNGVYAVEVVLNSQRQHKGMMNIGLRPTVDGKTRTIEVNIFDFDQDIYGQTLKVIVRSYIRGEVKFAGLDKLKEQLALDKVAALETL